MSQEPRMTVPDMTPLGAPVDPLPSGYSLDGRTLEGRFARLEKLDIPRHGDALSALAVEEPARRWAYLPVGPFDERAAAKAWLKGCADSADPFFYAIIPKDQAPQGVASYLRMDPKNGVIEIGWIWLSNAMARSAASTEALYLMMAHAFDDLGVRRLEWKCNALNAPSCAAAKRLGFTHEGVFRQHQVNKGRNRDSAWFSLLDSEWPKAKSAFERWLAPENFDAQGRQRARLEDLRA